MDSKADTKQELTEENIEGVIIKTDGLKYRQPYEWVCRNFDPYVDGREIYPVTDDEGNFQEMMVQMGSSYGELITSFIRDVKESPDAELVGYADNMEEAQELTREHYYSNK